MKPPMLRHELAARAEGHASLAGVDEAGRGPLAGPVVAAAVSFDWDWLEREGEKALAGLTDSKKLSPKRREFFYGVLTEGNPAIRWSVGEAGVEEIDRLNILRATYTAMGRALRGLNPLPEFALVDGLPVEGLPVPHRAIVGGDGASWSIAAASVIAKVTRDRWMEEAEGKWPGYGFARHKGYGTKEHQEALERLGPCPLHRRSFLPARQGRLF